jgi:superoxide dismutase, Fe-Mn family
MASQKRSSRRDFIIQSARAGMGITLGLSAWTGFLESCTPAKRVRAGNVLATPYLQEPLPYAYNALEPVIDAMTMEIHYSKHAAAYLKNLLEAAQNEKADTNKPLEEVLANISKFSSKMRNNAGGHYNHELFWKSMKAGGGGKPSGKLLTAIEETFGTFDAFKTRFSDAGKNRFGSGWAWLVTDNNKKLNIGSTPNQDNPLMDISELKGIPLLGLDVWEHAYYLKYQNKRADYITNWWNVINWDFVEKRYASVIA